MVVQEEYPTKETDQNVLIDNYIFETGSFSSVSSILFDTIKTSLSSWEIGTKKSITIHNGTLKLEGFYLKILAVERYFPDTERISPTLQIYSIGIPEKYRRMGLAYKIIDIIEVFATEKRLRIIIGPVIEEAMHLLVEKRGKYRQRTIFDWFY